MYKPICRLFFLLMFQTFYTFSYGKFQDCCDGWEQDDWYELTTLSDGSKRYYPECKNNVTTTKLYQSGSILLVKFQPRNQFGVLAMSFCEQTFEKCYVAEIFGLVSGRMGYYWRKHSRNETGEHLWVPGRNTSLPSTLLQSDVRVRRGTWDPEGKTVYQFYIESWNTKILIRYNGGTPKQQKEMTFKVPFSESRSFLTVASNDSEVAVEGATGCVKFKRMQFEPGQDINLFWDKQVLGFGAIGLSFCTDSGQNECFVLEAVLTESKFNHSWRKHFLFEEEGEEGWVPGRETKLNGTVLAQQEIDLKSTSQAPIRIFVSRTFNERLKVEFGLFRRDVTYTPSNLTFIIPSSYLFATAANRYFVNGKEVNGDDLQVVGPCYNGHRFGYIAQTCSQQIPPENPHPDGSRNDFFKVLSPKPGLAEAVLKSGVLESKAVRKNLCMFVHGLASHRGASLVVEVMDATGKYNQSVEVGQLIYNKIYPPEWQRVRLSVDLPPDLQSTPLIIKTISKRPTAQSVVLLSEAKLCSQDGCGLPSAEGVANIAHGTNASAAKYPWHVAIFKTENRKRYTFICGGSLIRPDAVISAAHCFFNHQSMLEDPSVFKFAVGKKYKSLYQSEPNQQLSTATEIHIPTRYNGIHGNFIHDIAVIRVKFEISSVILPVCLDWFNNLPPLQSGHVGEVAGWGVTEKRVESPVLLFAKLPYIPYRHCVETVPETFVPFVTPDKFCAGNVNGSTVGRGDSGGGLVFETGGLMYLRGVVSTGAPEQLTYSTFTNVEQFIPWIRQVLNLASNE